MEVGTRVKIYEVDRGTRESMRRRAKNLRDHLLEFVDRKYPLELWVLSYRASPDPWGGYEIFAEFHGVVDRVQTKGKWKAKRRRERRAKATT